MGKRGWVKEEKEGNQNQTKEVDIVSKKIIEKRTQWNNEK